MLKTIELNNFTIFQKLKIQFSPGINIFIGENGSGKTHILKASYVACNISKSKEKFSTKLVNVFYPSGKNIKRLINKPSVKSFIRAINNQDFELKFSLDTNKVIGSLKEWNDNPIETIFISSSDILPNAPGFRSLYKFREIHFEEHHDDLLCKAFLPPLKNINEQSKKILNNIQKIINGKIIIKNEEFYLKSKNNEIEFSLLNKGFHKIGLLSVLVQNGTLSKGSMLFWDEPENSLSYDSIKKLVNILFELQELGVQIFISTHNHLFLKELNIQKTKENNVLFHQLHKNTNEIEIISKDS